MPKVTHSKYKKAIDDLIDRTVTQLEQLDDAVLRARVCHEIVSGSPKIAERFGDMRTAAFQQLADEGWSITDMAVEFELTRARVAQIKMRENYKQGISRGGRTKPRQASDQRSKAVGSS